MADRNILKRRQAIHRRFEQALARRELVDGVQDQALSLELARLRGIEEEAFRLIAQLADDPLVDGDLGHHSRAAVTRLEHALLVENAAVPTLQPATDLIALLEDDNTFSALCDELHGRGPRA